MFGGISLLVPAMVLTIGISEMVHEALEAGVLRVAYAFLRFLMLGFGIATAMKVFGQLGAPTAVVGLAGVRWGRLIPGRIDGAGRRGAHGLLLQGRWKDTPWMVAGVLVAFGSQELTKLIFPPVGSAFLATFLLTGPWPDRAIPHGRPPPGHPDHPRGFLQIAPGFLGSEEGAGAAAPGRSHHAANENFFHVGLLALQLVTGALVAEAVLGYRGPRRSPRVRKTAA